VIEKLNGQVSKVKEERDKIEEQEKKFKQKVDEMYKDISGKVDSAHDNLKKIMEIHKTNEELSQKLISKSNQANQLTIQLQDSQSSQSELRTKLA
jgi:uncharacterized coiled-coil DUF342 family protein